MLIIDSTNFLPNSYRHDFGVVPEVFLPIGGKILLTALCEALHFDYQDTHVILPHLSSPNPYSLDVVNHLTPEVNVHTPDSFPIDICNNISDFVFVSHLSFPLSSEFSINSSDSSSLIFRCDKPLQATSFSGFLTKITNTALLDYSNDNLVESVDLAIPSNYFRLRSQLVNVRFFNSLSINANVLTKTCKVPGKAREEWLWYDAANKIIPNLVPVPIKYTPPESYSIEYYPSISLSETFVFGNLSLSCWKTLLAELQSFFSYLCVAGNDNYSSADKPNLDNFVKNFVEHKLYERLELFSDSFRVSFGHDIYSLPLSLNGSQPLYISDIIEYSLDSFHGLTHVPFLFHGDLCLSNILYDSRLNTFRAIDPRGILSRNQTGVASLVASQVYDMMKLCHSFLGGYDFINYGYIALSSYSISSSLDVSIDFSLPENVALVQKLASGLSFDGIHSLSDYYPSTILLFLSMLPLHSDSPEKQLTLLANSFKIYQECLK